MCTAITFRSGCTCFGRNLDLEYTLDESVVVTPRAFPLPFRHLPTLSSHHAIIGVAHIAQNYPLYYDAANEYGLCMAGLNFPGNARYSPARPDRENIAPFELLPWLLAQCASVEQALILLKGINLLQLDFSQTLPLTPLHWLLADRDQAIVLEPMADGLHIHENPVGVLTNNPPFPDQLSRLSGFLNLTAEEPRNRFAPALSLQPDSRGTGTMGLPGDLSSPSRFLRAAFVRAHACCDPSEEACVTQVFHILDSVAQIRGCVQLKNGSLEWTRYSSCFSMDSGVFYYTTYENRQITGISLKHADLESSHLISYPMVHSPQIRMEAVR